MQVIKLIRNRLSRAQRAIGRLVRHTQLTKAPRLAVGDPMNQAAFRATIDEFTMAQAIREVSEARDRALADAYRNAIDAWVLGTALIFAIFMWVFGGRPDTPDLLVVVGAGAIIAGTVMYVRACRRALAARETFYAASAWLAGCDLNSQDLICTDA